MEKMDSDVFVSCLVERISVKETVFLDPRQERDRKLSASSLVQKL